MKTLLLVFVIGVLIANACSKTKTVASIDCSTAKSWSSDVSPVILSSCSYSSGCHASGSSKGPGALVTYQQVYNNRAAVRSSVVSGRMPEQGSLSAAALSAIVCWFDAGAAEN